VRLNHVMLRSADVARALRFYEGLGLQRIVMEPGDDGSPRYARLRCPDGDATLSIERGAAKDDGDGAVVIFLECDDLDQRVAALAASGYPIAARPETKPWLWREAELVDPDGHAVRLYHAGSYRQDPPWRLPGTAAPEREAGDADDDGETRSFRSAGNHGYADAPIPSARVDVMCVLLV
jgi:catechol 2,3-dioxygenase-like lactoylglutathione lyase family enzyme